MGRVFIALKSIAVSSHLVQNVLNLKKDIEGAESQSRQKEQEDAWNDEKYINFKTSIDVQNLHYSYEREANNGKNTFILNDISLSIPKGTFAGFVGPSGGGKTTLINLIIGLITPDKGTIQWDGNNMNTPQEKVRFWKHIGYVSQNPVILPVSIRDNITANMKRSASSFGTTFLQYARCYYLG